MEWGTLQEYSYTSTRSTLTFMNLFTLIHATTLANGSMTHNKGRRKQSPQTKTLENVNLVNYHNSCANPNTRPINSTYKDEMFNVSVSISSSYDNCDSVFCHQTDMKRRMGWNLGSAGMQ